MGEDARKRRTRRIDGKVRQPADVPRPTRGEGRARILDVALDLFADRGFDAVSTTDIARAAGSSQSVVLYHFSTKEALWREAMRALFDRVDPRHGAHRNIYKDLEPADRLKVLLRSFVMVSARVPQLGRVVFREGLSGGERLRWLFTELAQPQFDIFVATIRELQAAGRMDGWDPVALTLMIHGAGATLFNLAPLTELLTGELPFAPAAIERQSDMLVTAFFDGLVGDPSPATAGSSAAAPDPD